jgi:hypothetical protein
MWTISVNNMDAWILNGMCASIFLKKTLKISNTPLYIVCVCFIQKYRCQHVLCNEKYFLFHFCVSVMGLAYMSYVLCRVNITHITNVNVTSPFSCHVLCDSIPHKLYTYLLFLQNHGVSSINFHVNRATTRVWEGHRNVHCTGWNSLSKLGQCL